METLESAIYIFTFFIALIGAFFVAQIFIYWEKVKRDLLQARIFLAKRFVLTNLFLVASTGFFISVHNLMMIVLNRHVNPGNVLINVSSPVALMFAITCLTLLAYEWNKVVVASVAKD